MVLIQILIIASIIVVGVRFLLSSGQRNQAARRILLVALGVFAVLSVLFPEIWSRVADALGVGRGTDLLLYALTIAFLSYVATSYRRERALEASVTKLARRIALDEAALVPSRRHDAVEPTDRTPQGQGDSL